MTVSEYADLKRQIVVSIERHGQLLQTLKKFYESDIDSLRRFTQINKVGELLNVLEIRDVLSKDNVEPLKEIARRLPNKVELLRKISEYEEGRRYHDSSCSYEPEHPLNSSTQQQGCSPLKNHPFGSLTDKKRQRIINTIVEEIGTNWRDFARNLKEIRECTIDEIDSNNDSLPSKAEKVMEKFEEKADPQRWFFILCNALERTRRKDLARTLQKIMAMNI